MSVTDDDPKGVIAESFRIEGISLADCRGIFLDWLLSQPADRPIGPAVDRLLDRHAAANHAHPMIDVLRRARDDPPPRRRRGGFRSRRT